MSYDEGGERFSILLRPPTEKAHWQENGARRCLSE